MTLRVKVCGITRVQDALLAEGLGAHALGFIFHPPSPRYVSPEVVAGIARALHPFTLRVGVFVNTPAARINEIVGLCGLDRVQLHGGEPYEALADLNRPGYRALRLRSQADLEAARLVPDRTLMLDTYDPEHYGGTGRPFDWAWARDVGRTRRVILAGGLSPRNVVEAVTRARPAAVDVSSALEAGPGRKDPAKVEAFFHALRAANLLCMPTDSPGSVAHVDPS